MHSFRKNITFSRRVYPIGLEFTLVHFLLRTNYLGPSALYPGEIMHQGTPCPV